MSPIPSFFLSNLFDSLSFLTILYMLSQFCKYPKKITFFSFSASISATKLCMLSFVLNCVYVERCKLVEIFSERADFGIWVCEILIFFYGKFLFWRLE